MAKKAPKPDPITAAAPPSVPLPPGPGRDFYESISTQFELTDGDQQLLLNASWMLHRIHQVREAIEQTGVISTDRYGNVCENPLLGSERQLCNAFRLTARELGLVVDNPAPRLQADATYHR